MWKFVTVSRGIRQTGLQNVEKFAAENCGPWYSLCPPRDGKAELTWVAGSKLKHSFFTLALFNPNLNHLQVYDQ